MLINQARNLASLPYSALQQLAAERPAHPAAPQPGAEHRLRRPEDRPDVPAAIRQRLDVGVRRSKLVADARSRWQNTVGGLQDAMRVQAGVVGNIDTNRTQMSALVSQSQGATGALAGDAGRQSAPRAAIAAALRSDALISPPTAAPGADRGRTRRRRRTGPRAAPPLPDAGLGLPARQRPDVQQRQLRPERRAMDGKMLARLGAIVFVASPSRRPRSR
jgi:hypothetical protein